MFNQLRSNAALLNLIRFTLGCFLVFCLLDQNTLFSGLYLYEEAWKPVGLAHLLYKPPSDLVSFALLVLCFFSATLMLLGLFRRYIFGISFVLFLFALTICYSYIIKIHHSYNALVVIVFIYSFFEWEGLSFKSVFGKSDVPEKKEISDTQFDWLFWLSNFSISLAYFSAGLLKLVKGAYLFCTDQLSILIAGNIVNTTINLYQQPEWLLSLKLFLINNPLILYLMGVAAVFVELFTFLSLIDRLHCLFFLSCLLCLHASIAVLMSIPFNLQMALYVLFIVILIFKLTVVRSPEPNMYYLRTLDNSESIEVSQHFVTNSRVIFVTIVTLLGLINVADFIGVEKSLGSIKSLDFVANIFNNNSLSFPITAVSIFNMDLNLIMGLIYFLLGVSGLIAWLYFTFFASGQKTMSPKMLLYNAENVMASKWAAFFEQAFLGENFKTMPIPAPEGGAELFKEANIQFSESNQPLVLMDNSANYEGIAAICRLFILLPGIKYYFKRVIGKLYFLPYGSIIPNYLLSRSL